MLALFTDHRFVAVAARTRALWAPFAPWPLRLIVGYGFFAHGYAKLGRGAGHFTSILEAIGTPQPALMAWMTILVEIIGGIAILIGFGVPIAAIPMAIILIVAMFTVHLPYGFSSIKLLAVTANGAQFGMPGYETDLIYLAALAALVMGGPGRFAVDNLIVGERTKNRMPKSMC